MVFIPNMIMEYSVHTEWSCLITGSDKDQQVCVFSHSAEVTLATALFREYFYRPYPCHAVCVLSPLLTDSRESDKLIQLSDA